MEGCGESGARIYSAILHLSSFMRRSYFWGKCIHLKLYHFSGQEVPYSAKKTRMCLGELEYIMLLSEYNST